MICSRVLWHQYLYFLLGIQLTLCTYKNRPLLLIWGLRVTLRLFCFQRQKFPCHSITCATNHFFWLFTALIKSSKYWGFLCSLSEQYMPANVASKRYCEILSLLVGNWVCMYGFLFSSVKQETSFIRDLTSKTVKHLTTEAYNSTLCRAMSTK